jgi:hypothetical protein
MRCRNESIIDKDLRLRQELDEESVPQHSLNVPMAVMPLMFEWARKIGLELLAVRNATEAVHVRYFVSTDTPQIVQLAREYLGAEAVRALGAASNDV